MVAPADIAKKKFSVTRLKAGYDADEVDSFLDRVGRAMAELEAKVAAQPDVARILTMAQGAGDQAIAEAKLEARRLIAEGEAGARKALADATTAVESQRATAEAELEKVSVKLADVKAVEKSARQFLTEHLGALKDKLEGQS